MKTQCKNHIKLQFQTNSLSEHKLWKTRCLCHFLETSFMWKLEHFSNNLLSLLQTPWKLNEKIHIKHQIQISNLSQHKLLKGELSVSLFRTSFMWILKHFSATPFPLMNNSMKTEIGIPHKHQIQRSPLNQAFGSHNLLFLS